MERATIFTDEQADVYELEGETLPGVPVPAATGTGAGATSEPHLAATHEPGATAAEQAERAKEVLVFTVLAFGIGITIGLFFLIYIALSFARWF